MKPSRRKSPLIANRAKTVDESSSTPAQPLSPGGLPQILANNLVDRTYWYLKKFLDGYGGDDARLVEDLDKGNLVSSRCKDGMHAPLFDIDYDADLIPSRTDGHYHLYLNKKIPWDKYVKVLEAMSDAGLIEEGYYIAAKRRKMAMLRPPSEHGPYEELRKKIKTAGTLFFDE